LFVSFSKTIYQSNSKSRRSCLEILFIHQQITEIDKLIHKE